MHAGNKMRTGVRVALTLTLLAGIALAVYYREHLDPENLEAWVESLGFWGPLAYLLLYTIGTILIVPGSALTLASGVLFGPIMGTVYTVIGATVGASIAFVLSRYLAADWVENKASGMILQIKKGVEDEGWLFVAFVRLVPLFPFNLLNYVLGLTRIPLGVFTLTSAVCMIPGSAGYVYLGYAGREALLGGDDWIGKVLLAVAVFAALILIPLMLRRWRKSRNPGPVIEIP